ncbi:MAG: hypothetical protein HY238_22265 [Acidobacteria bacterium]|nr:hypothetical protein [Acidobacteriota bacterium]
MKTRHWIVALALGAGGLTADTIHLRSGRRVEGTFMGGDTRQVRMMGADGNLQSYDITEIESIRFGGGGATATAPAAAPRAVSRPASSGAGGVVPAGTVITVRMIEAVDSDATTAGERFRASLDDPLQIGEKTIAARGSDCTVQVVRVQQSGKLTGRDEVSLELYDITINGKKYPVATSYAEAHSGSRGARTGKVVGGGAALGAIIGAIAGGGKGAAIGAASGAGAGVAVEEMTKGQRVKIPSESRLDFTLKQALAVD